MKSHFDSNDYQEFGVIWNSIYNRPIDLWGCHEIKKNGNSIKLYTGAGPVTGYGVVNFIFPKIKKDDKVLILTGSHGDPYGRTGAELKGLIDQRFLLEDAESIARNSAKLQASVVNALDIDKFTTKEIDDAYLNGSIDADDRQFNFIIAAFCFSEVRFNALNDLLPESVTFKKV